jgi:hypothetical protein
MAQACVTVSDRTPRHAGRRADRPAGVVRQGSWAAMSGSDCAAPMRAGFVRPMAMQGVRAACALPVPSGRRGLPHPKPIDRSA